MIVKAISHQSPSKGAMQKLINYVFEPAKLKDDRCNRKALIIKQNISGYDQERWLDTFHTNDQNRTFEHQKRTVLRHEIVSFSKEDNPKITREALQNMGKWYLKNRSNSIGVCGVHWEDSIHMHFILSGVGLDGKSTRISRKAFKDFKIRLQDYQQENYPELTNSIVNHSKKKK